MKPMRKSLFIFLFLAISSVGFGQEFHAKFVATKIVSSVSPGDKAVVIVTATVDPGWHLYPSNDQEGPSPTTFSGADDLTVLDGVTNSAGVVELDKGFNKQIESLTGTATFKVPVKFGAKGTSSGLSVLFQTCKDGKCTIPADYAISLKDVPIGADEPVKSAAPTSGESANVQKAKSAGLLPYLQLAFLAGLTALLTPCVFPMIPITVSFFAKKKSEGSSPLSQALLYCAGIIGTFTILGVGVSVLFGATGLNQLANNPWVNLGLALIFIALALSLFGVFELGLPSKFVNKFDATGKSGFIAPILMGLTFSLTSFTCTLPFVGAVLFSAAQGDIVYPILGMLTFSTAFCLPFFLLALFPQAMSKLPRSGAWMVTVKAYMGFIELIAAVKFLSSFDIGMKLGFITRETNLAIWFLLLGMAGAYLMGWITLPKVSDGKIGWLRRLFALGTFVLSIWILKGLNGGKLGDIAGYLPPSSVTSKVQHKIPFLSDYNVALRTSKETRKPIFIDFTGKFCTNCRVFEENIFPVKEVETAAKKFVTVQLYVDTPETKDNLAIMLKLTNSSTLPVYAIVQTNGKVLTHTYTEDAKEFAQWMNDNAI
jgi:thiol:disulfide interchange protein